MSRNRSSIAVSEDTRERLKEAKPYSSVTYDEFVNELLDEYDDCE